MEDYATKRRGECRLAATQLSRAMVHVPKVTKSVAKMTIKKDRACILLALNHFVRYDAFVLDRHVVVINLVLSAYPKCGNKDSSTRPFVTKNLPLND